MSRLGKIITGAAVGVIAVAAAPFTGGGSVLAGASIGASLAGAGTIATAVGAGVVGAVVGSAVEDVEDEEHLNDIKDARENGFKDGVNEGMDMGAAEIEKYANFYLATTALSYFAARCDGSISEEEQMEIDYDLEVIKKNCDISDGVKNKMIEISKNENLSWDDVVLYLDKVGIDTLEKLREDVIEIIEASDGVLPQEEKVKQDFDIYLEKRKSGDNDFVDDLIFALSK